MAKSYMLAIIFYTMVLFVVSSGVLDLNFANFAMFTHVYEIGVYDLVMLMFNIPAAVYLITVLIIKLVTKVHNSLTFSSQLIHSDRTRIIQRKRGKGE